MGGAIGLIVLVALLRYSSNHRITSQIPGIPSIQTLAIPVKDQLLDAQAKAKRTPSAKNLGKLGMAFHSSAYYEQATACYELAIQRNEKEWIWYYYLGYLHMEMGDSDAVIENFNAVA